MNDMMMQHDGDDELDDYVMQSKKETIEKFLSLTMAILWIIRDQKSNR